MRNNKVETTRSGYCYIRKPVGNYIAHSLNTRKMYIFDSQKVMADFFGIDYDHMKTWWGKKNVHKWRGRDGKANINFHKVTLIQAQYSMKKNVRRLKIKEVTNEEMPV